MERSVNWFYATDVGWNLACDFYEIFYHKRDFFRNILLLDILKNPTWNTLQKRTLVCKFCSRKESPYEISFRCVKVNDIIQHEKKKNDQQPKFLKVDRQVTVASKKHWMKSEVWASSSLRVYSKCQHQLKHVRVLHRDVTSIFSALNRRQMERRWDTTRVHLVPKLLFFNLGFYLSQAPSP